MTTDPPTGKPRALPRSKPVAKAQAQLPPPAARHVYGPRVIGALLPAVTRAAYRSQGGAAARLVADWPGIIGPRLAAITTPRRLAAGTLTLGCAGPVALELQHLAGPLIDRVNTYLGHPTVQRLRFVQETPAAQAVPQAARRTALDPVAVDLPEGKLRDALAALGAVVRAERA